MGLMQDNRYRYSRGKFYCTFDTRTDVFLLLLDLYGKSIILRCAREQLYRGAGDPFFYIKLHGLNACVRTTN